MQLKAFYGEKIASLTSEIVRLRGYGKRFVAAELSLFGMAVACVVACLWGLSLWGHSWTWLALAAIALAVYLAVRWHDVRMSERRASCERLLRVYEHERDYLDGNYSPFADGRQFVDEQHPFAVDLDLFGTSSLFQRINRAVTSGGEAALAVMLSETEPPSLQVIDRRREAVSELADNEPLRTTFCTYGLEGTIDETRVQQVVAAAKAVRVARWPLSAWSLALSWAAIIAFAIAFLAYLFDGLTEGQLLFWATIQFCMVTLACSHLLRQASQVLTGVRSALERYQALVQLIAEAHFSSPLLVGLRDKLSADGHDACACFRELTAILDALDRRGNFLAYILFNTFALSDYFLVRRFLRWQGQYVEQMKSWVEAVSQFDALVSMDTFRFNEPLTTDAEWTDDGTVTFEAQGLWHPFVGATAVRNDFSLADQHYYIITGANMAGKSTFLRAIGINVVLARAGLPVFAEALTLSRFALFTSMRTTDDLTHGFSYFNAELLRLRQLLQAVRSRSVHGSSGNDSASVLPTLIILDEILKGTNSLDKLNGSRLFLEYIAQLPVTGVVATHDLELSRMADEHPDRFHTYCFEISLADDITYTYRITPGVARNQNATHLLRQILGN
jgi:hypothetical protein